MAWELTCSETSSKRLPPRASRTRPRSVSRSSADLPTRASRPRPSASRRRPHKGAGCHGRQAQAIFTAAQQQGISTVVLTPANQLQLDALNLPADATARISSALAAGMWVVVPSKAVTINGTQRVGWFQVDPTTGETSGVLDDGMHAGEYTAPQCACGQGAVPASGVRVRLHRGVPRKSRPRRWPSSRSGLFPEGLATKAEKAAIIAVAVAGINDIREVDCAAGDPSLLTFYLGVIVGSSLALANLHADPPVPSVLLNPSGSVLPATNTATASVAEPASDTRRCRAGHPDDRRGSGRRARSWPTWSSTTASAFSVQSLTATCERSRTPAVTPWVPGRPTR